MASLSITFACTEGTYAASFNMSNEDMLRMYNAYKTTYTSEDDPEKMTYEDEYSLKNVFTRLSDDLMYQVVKEVQNIERQEALAKLSIDPINIRV